LEREHGNLRAALSYSLEVGATETVLRMVGGMWQFWWMHGHTVEGSKWLERALASVSAEHGGVPAAVLAKALNAAGSMSAYLGDFDHARTLLEQSLAQRRAIGDKQGTAASLNNLGTVSMQQGDYTRAGQLYEEGLALRRELGGVGPIAMSLLNLGNLALRHGNYKEAVPFYTESLEIFRGLGDGQHIAMALGNLGLAALYQDDYEGAEPLLEESLTVSREMGNTRQVALMLNSLTCVALSRKECVQARAMSQKSLMMYRELGDTKGVADCLQALAETDMQLGEKDHKASIRAAVLLAAQDALREVIGYPLTPFGRPLYEQTVAVVRAQLDEAAWAQAWVEGHSMSTEEIIAYALADVR
jgi:tetratricopeptide (TPR) repeat protein